MVGRLGCLDPLAAVRCLMIPLILVGHLTGCQAPSRSVSLDEARQITGQFVGAEIKTPPRSIDDLLMLLDDYKPGRKQGRLQVAEQRAASQPDAETRGDPERLVQFLHRRGQARARVGRATDSLEDFNRAIELSRQHLTPGHDFAELLYDAVWMEVDNGSYRRATRLAQEAHRYYRWPYASYSALGRLYAWSGRLDKAREMLAGLLRDGQRDVTTDFHEPRLRANLAGAEGDWPRAEALFRETLDLQSQRAGGWWLEWSKEATRYHIARALVGQGRISEAELLMRDVLAANLRRLGNSANQHTVLLTLELSRILVAAGRFEEAEAMSGKTVELSNLARLPETS